MNREQLIAEIKKKESFLCLGLDTDITKIPSHLLKEEDPVFEFNKQIIDATKDLCIAYKPNTAFYESRGAKGWRSLEKTSEYISKLGNLFSIADAKRGDIGNTSGMYAQSFFEQMSFDAVTVAPYMGHDSVSPFLNQNDKWVILLALTSNEGAKDFQFYSSANNKPLFQEIMEKAMTWASIEQLMFVVGATRADKLQELRKIAPDYFFLVPGVGAQGGSLQEVSKFGMNKDCGLLVNSSRQILYAGNGPDFASQARDEADKLQKKMKSILMHL